MNSAYRRFEILLPLRFNDGRAVPGELIANTLLGLEQRFGAVSSETQVIQGFWQHQGQSYRDDLTRLFVDVPDTVETLEFFRRIEGTAQGAVRATRHLDDELPARRHLALLALGVCTKRSGTYLPRLCTNACPRIARHRTL